jgi:hypothetical protein
MSVQAYSGVLGVPFPASPVTLALTFGGQKCFQRVKVKIVGSGILIKSLLRSPGENYFSISQVSQW